MYQLIIERANGTSEDFQFNSFEEREDFITNNWDDSAEFLVPTGWGGWIDIRDCY